MLICVSGVLWKKSETISPDSQLTVAGTSDNFSFMTLAILRHISNLSFALFYRFKFAFGLHFNAENCLAALSLCGPPLIQSQSENNGITKNLRKLLEINACKWKLFAALA